MSPKNLDELLAEILEKASGELYLHRREAAERLVAALEECRRQRNEYISANWEHCADQDNQTVAEIGLRDAAISAKLDGRSE